MTDAATFVTHFPEFANTTSYPTSRINFWMDTGRKLLSNQRWIDADLLDEGLELFTAHHIVLAQQNTKSAASGAAPGTNTGSVTSKSVDKVSVSYDTNASLVMGAGHWNLTTYGIQFIMMAKMVGAGGVQI